MIMSYTYKYIKGSYFQILILKYFSLKDILSMKKGKGGGFFFLFWNTALYYFILF
jgi:hypothetical protein